MLLAPQCVHHRRAEGVGQRHHLIVGTGTAAATQQGDFLAALEHVGEALQVLLNRHGARCVQGRPRLELIFHLQQRHIPRNHHHRHASVEDRRTHGTVQHLRHLLGVAHQLDKVAALLEQFLGMGFLKVIQANLRGRNLRGNRQHRHMVAMAVEQPIDQMQVTRPATAGAHRQLAGGRRFGTGSEGGDLLVAHMHPLDAVHAAQGVGQAIEAVAGEPPDTLDTRLFQGGRQLLGQVDFRHEELQSSVRLKNC